MTDVCSLANKGGAGVAGEAGVSEQAGSQAGADVC